MKGRSAWEFYAVKLIHRAVVEGEPIPERVDERYSDTHQFFEESVVLVRAQSFDHAYTVAERRAGRGEREHRNPYGQTVRWELVEAVDCYRVGEEVGDGVEVYSRYTPVEKAVEPAAYVKGRYGYSMEDDDWNEEQRRERIRLQTMLTYEQFSRWRQG